MFIRLFVLTLFISGVSTRGVPAADDTNGIHVEPKRTQTDTTDQSSEHVTLTECKGINNKCLVQILHSYINLVQLLIVSSDRSRYGFICT